MERVAMMVEMEDAYSLEEYAARLVIRRFGHRPFTLEQYIQLVPIHISPAAWHAALLRLWKQRLVHLMRKSWGERLYQIPVTRYFDLLRQWASAELPVWTADRERIIAGSTVHLTMSQKMLVILIELEQRPLHVTKKGTLSKRCMERLANIVQASSSASDEERHRDVLDALDLLWRMKLIYEEEASLKIDVSRISDWLSLDNITREDQLFTIWYRVHHPEDPALQWVTATLRNMREASWIRHGDIQSLLAEQGMELTSEMLEHWLLRLHNAGWIELGRDDRGVSLVRKRETVAEEQRTLVIQQDFEIIAFPNTSYAVIYQLHRCADRVSWEGLLRCRLCSSSLYRAFDHGWDATAVNRFLDQHAIDPIAESVTSTICRWERDRAEVHMMRGIVLHVNQARAAMMLEAATDRLKLTRLSDRYWLVESMDEHELTDRFAQLGLQVAVSNSDRSRLPDVIQIDADEEGRNRASNLPTAHLEQVVKDALHPQAPGFYKPKDLYYLYSMDRISSIERELYPDYEQVPAMWYEQYRKYHPSTARHIIEQAIRWKTSVRIRTADDEYDFLPISIDDTGDRCKIKGRCGEKSYLIGIHEIDKVKLLAPGLHD